MTSFEGSSLVCESSWICMLHVDYNDVVIVEILVSNIIGGVLSLVCEVLKVVCAWCVIHSFNIQILVLHKIVHK